VSDPRGDVNVDARAVLTERGADVRSIVRVNPDAILYVDGLRRARTAWLGYTGVALRIAFDSGFPAEPSPASRRLLDRTAAGEDLRGPQIKSD
jgi:hypothetical protein